MKIIQVVVQHFHGCPDGPKLLKNVKDAINDLDENINFSEQIIDTPELASRYHFRGSPTLLIQGEDFEGVKAPDNPALACRFYTHGLPSAEKIRESILNLIDG